jgi:tetratricopeptide (TPR) repeat protein
LAKLKTAFLTCLWLAGPAVYNAYGVIDSALFDRADSLLGSGNNQAALDIFIGLTEGEQVFTGTYYKMGICYSRMQNHELAIASFRQFLIYDSENVHGLHGLAGEFYIQGRLDSALYYYHRIVAVDKKDLEARYWLGRISLARGDWKGAAGYFNSCLKINPQYEPAHGGLWAASLKPVERSVNLSLIPGAGHIYRGEYARGMAFLAATSSLGYLAFKNHRYSAVEFNDLYMLSIYSNYRRAFLGIDRRYLDVPHQDQPYHDLVIFPFRPDNLFEPWTVAGLGTFAGLSFFLRDNRSGAEILNRYTLAGAYHDFTSRDIDYYSAAFLYNMLLIAPAEEAFFHGVIQNWVAERIGEKSAIHASALLFGAAHIGSGWENVLLATLFGYFSSWRYKNSGYNLGQSITLHFWFNFIEFTRDREDWFR